MFYYYARKEELRLEAIEWRADFDNHDHSYGELCEFQQRFARLARRYGLVKEFRENGII